MGTNECSQSASKSSWDSQDFGDVNMVLKWPIFTSPLGHIELSCSYSRYHQYLIVDMVFLRVGKPFYFLKGTVRHSDMARTFFKV